MQNSFWWGDQGEPEPPGSTPALHSQNRGNSNALQWSLNLTNSSSIEGDHFCSVPYFSRERPGPFVLNSGMGWTMASGQWSGQAIKMPGHSQRPRTRSQPQPPNSGTGTRGADPVEPSTGEAQTMQPGGKWFSAPGVPMGSDFLSCQNNKTWFPFLRLWIRLLGLDPPQNPPSPGSALQAWTLNPPSPGPVFQVWTCP